jgi:hypothetical protein
MHLSAFKRSNGCFRPDDVQLSSEESETWQYLEKNLPHPDIWSDTHQNLPALTDCYVHIISETTVIDRIFLSEKTWKPIASGQLFAMFGNPGSMTFLSSVGVDTFCDIIDHAAYDNILDWQERMIRMHQVIQDLQKENMQRIWDHTRTRRLENQKRLFAGEFNGGYVYPDIDPVFR